MSLEDSFNGTTIEMAKGSDGEYHPVAINGKPSTQENSFGYNSKGKSNKKETRGELFDLKS